MHRRQFLRLLAAAALGMGSPIAFAFPDSPRLTEDQKKTLSGLLIIDAHAHPDKYSVGTKSRDNASSLEAIRELGMAACAFAALGDTVAATRGHTTGTDYHLTRTQLDFWMDDLVKSGRVKPVRTASDIAKSTGGTYVPGAIFAIEGGDALSGNPDRVNDFHAYGVRMITLVHLGSNDLGESMAYSQGIGLTPRGRSIVGRMQELGVLVDVAHASSLTLKHVGEISRRPIVDSHTHPCPASDAGRCGRLRTWQGMEIVAKTGGVVCTWPMGDNRRSKRETFRDWALEIAAMKKRIGMEHVGLGTDGGGGLPRFIDGYRDVRDLVFLVKAMREEGFTQDEIYAYMGGNFYRVLQKSIG
jgi:microsomal dipeptidase-like Zn-dependent dipeptidase